MAPAEPNEATIASSTNRALLDALDDPSSWVMIPTNVAEAALGYDASFDVKKLGVIQYKRAEVHSEGVSATIEPAQHETLRRQFPEEGGAFYAFGTYRSFRDLDLAHQGDQVLTRTLFVDAADFPVGTTTLRYEGRSPTLTGVKRIGQIVAFQDGSPQEVRPFLWSGSDWLDQFTGCRLGVEPEMIDRGGDALGGTTTFLLWKGG